MKKLLLSFGTVAAIATPITAVVSCGNKKQDVKTKPEITTTIKKEKQHLTDAQLKDASKLFLNKFIADENLLLNPIHSDSMNELVNNMIDVWRKVEDEKHFTHAFDKSFKFDNSNISSIKEVTEFVTPILHSLLDNLGSGAIKAIMPMIKGVVTKELVNSFLSEKYVSTGIAVLVRKATDTIEDLLKNNAIVRSIAQPSSLVSLIGGMIPFGGNDVNNQDITLETGSNLVFKWKEKTTPANMMSTLTSMTSGVMQTQDGTTNSQESTTKLSISSLMKVMNDSAVGNLISGLLEGILSNTTISKLLRDTINNASQRILHINGESTFMSTTKLISADVVPGTDQTDNGKLCQGVVKWFVSTNVTPGHVVYTFKDENGKVLATGEGTTESSCSITFKVDKLPLKENVIGNGIFGDQVNSSQHTVSIKELASELYVRQAIQLVGMAAGTLIIKMNHYVAGIEFSSRNPLETLAIDFDSKIRMANIFENGRTDTYMTSHSRDENGNMVETRVNIIEKLTDLKTLQDRMVKIFRDNHVDFLIGKTSLTDEDRTKFGTFQSDHGSQVMPLLDTYNTKLQELQTMTGRNFSLFLNILNGKNN